MFGNREGRSGGAARIEPTRRSVRSLSRCVDPANTLTVERFQFNLCIIFIIPALFPGSVEAPPPLHHVYESDSGSSVSGFGTKMKIMRICEC